MTGKEETGTVSVLRFYEAIFRDDGRDAQANEMSGACSDLEKLIKAAEKLRNDYASADTAAWRDLDSALANCRI